MDLRTLILGGGHQWHGNPPASDEDIAELVATSPVPLPTEYLELLRLSDGGHASLSGYPSYVRIWSSQIAIIYNRDYEVQKFAPKFIGFGDNGGPDMVGFDTRQGEPYSVCSIPFVPLELESSMGQVPDFGVFIRQLLPVENSLHPPN